MSGWAWLGLGFCIGVVATLTPEVRRYVEAICEPQTRQAESRTAVAR